MVELSKGSEVFITKGQLNFIKSKGVGSFSKTINLLLDIFFDKETLASSSARGEGKYSQLNPAIVNAVTGLSSCSFSSSMASL